MAVVFTSFILPMLSGILGFGSLTGSLSTLGSNTCPPVLAHEGQRVTLDPACLGSADAYRWDFDGDGAWDTDWGAGTRDHVWSDDFSGLMKVQLGTIQEETDVRVAGDVFKVAFITSGAWAAQSFRPGTSRITRVAIDVSINWGNPSDLEAVIGQSLEEDGSVSGIISTGRIARSLVPRDRFLDEVRWPVIDIDDAAVDPGTTYFLLLRVTGTETGAYEVHNAGDVYSDGVFQAFQPPGPWQVLTNEDLRFKTFGVSLQATETRDIEVEILNSGPVILGFQFFAEASVELRVAGEKWHDVLLTVLEGRVERARLTVLRYPGNSDEQGETLSDFRFNAGSEYAFAVSYTPDDDPVNGQVTGADSVWVALSGPDRVEVRFHHTFDVQHPETWTWSVGLAPALMHLPFRFEATAVDPGSDDLTFVWDFGDGTPAVTATYFNDGVRPDPFPSLGGTFPFTAADRVNHSYLSPGDYVVTLTVADDDGDSSTTAIPIHIASPMDR